MHAQLRQPKVRLQAPRPPSCARLIAFSLSSFGLNSVFARILDRQKGGHFSISPVEEYRTKQSYLPNSNVLATKFLNEEGVALLTDTLLPRGAMAKGKAFLPWMIRRIEVVAGKVKFRVGESSGPSE